jgi:hypothetical protein
MSVVVGMTGLGLILPAGTIVPVGCITDSLEEEDVTELLLLLVNEVEKLEEREELEGIEELGDVEALEDVTPAMLDELLVKLERDDEEACVEDPIEEVLITEVLLVLELTELLEDAPQDPGLVTFE